MRGQKSWKDSFRKCQREPSRRSRDSCVTGKPKGHPDWFWFVMKPQDASCNTSQIVVFTPFSLVKALSPSYKTLAALFPLACYLSCQERGLGLSSVAELRFGKCSGMVEPLIYRKDWAPRKRTHLGSVRHKFSLSPGLPEVPHHCIKACCFVCWLYHAESTVPQMFKL